MGWILRIISKCVCRITTRVDSEGHMEYVGVALIDETEAILASAQLNVVDGMFLRSEDLAAFGGFVSLLTTSEVCAISVSMSFRTWMRCVPTETQRLAKIRRASLKIPLASHDRAAFRVIVESKLPSIDIMLWSAVDLQRFATADGVGDV